MSAQLLLREFERIGDAPNGIMRLRGFILDLAVRGKLLHQQPEDRPATAILTEIAAHERLPVTSPIAASDPPFEAPLGWQWARVSHLAHIEMGQSPPSESYNQSGNGVPFYQGKADFGLLNPTPRYWCTAPTKMAGAADILISVRAPVGPTNVATGDCCIGRGLTALRPYTGVEADYLLLVLRAFESDLAALGFGTTFVAIKKSQLATFCLPLPPLAEQHRIVAKVDELMALCDQLEAAQKERELHRDALRVVSLHRLTTAPEDAPAPDDVKFFLHKSPRFIKAPEHLAELRQTILDLAVSGRLLPQNPSDEPATALVRRIELSDGGVLSRARRPAPSPDRQVPEDTLPVGWVRVAVSHVFRVTGGIQKQPKRTPVKNAFPYLGVSNVQRGRLELERVGRFELFAGELEKLRLEVGDLLVVEGNGSANEIGRCARWNGEIINCVHQNHIIRCRALHEGLERFTLLYLNSPAGTATMRRLAITSAGLYSLSVGKIQRITIPLPPLEEQHRIVARVDELMMICDQLEEALTSAKFERGRLLEALLRDSLSGAGFAT